MSGLRDIQAGFLATVMAEGEDLSPGMKVYHHAYRSRLVEALRDRFERVWTWLGDTRFDDLARAYVARTPSTTWTLDAYGVGFDAFVAEVMPDDPEVAELAWLDGALRSVFAGADAGVLDVARLGEVDWEQARLVLAPTVTWRLVTTNVAGLWRRLVTSESPPQVVVLPEPAGLVVWRQGLEPQFRTLEADELRALQMLQAGARFAAVCAELEEVGEDATAKAGAWLGQWIGEQLVVDVVG